MTTTDAGVAVSFLEVKVVPGSSKNGIAGWLGESLKIRVTAKPEKGKANDAVIALLARTLGIPKHDLCVASGRSSEKKIIKINGLSETAVHSRLPARTGKGC